MKTTKYECAACAREFEKPITVRSECGVYMACPHCGCWDYNIERKTVVCREELKQYVHLVREIADMENEIERETQRSKTVEFSERYENNKLRCLALKLKTESFIFDIDDSFLRRIFEARYIKGMSWAAVSVALGGFYSADSLRMAHNRYLNLLEKNI